ncbi:CLIP domain-containing serine protease [Ophidiomyces ophidiicola]|nr:CLIP domain-containing serine protease [Ophidiomyces ophidiicola]KAI2013785.1 CLIP domain-containing serine protease [Ophidiomyces ophidiicola]KAI2026266.1 CLIP domain-containing serine protease [Ophidiomyces ophidiicola]KAI2134325.1 CLIP domain-containing serine protease [Ophidiomyces ophidiicola]KAI2136033.1 CLIP domain-containing serine protease [Ophidiomyces ophidiicola]
MTPLLAFTIALVMPAASMAAGPSFLEGQSRIVGGVEAKLGELPSTVALAESGLKSCGATLIGPKLALTAGHCAWNASKDFTLRAGSLTRGRTSVNPPSELVVNLRHVTVPIVKRSVCNENYQKRNASVIEQMICAGEEGKDACAGDSGSSLYDEITKELIGIVSWGYECALAGFPGVYTRVGYFVDWIKKNNKPPTIPSPRID